MELKPITISFKQTEDETQLYEIISKHTSKGSFIKDTLIDILIKKNVPAKEIQTSTQNKDELSEILDL
jgi:hypothetical protein